MCEEEVSARCGTHDSEEMIDEGRENILRWFCNPKLGGSKDSQVCTLKSNRSAQESTTSLSAQTSKSLARSTV